MTFQRELVIFQLQLLDNIFIDITCYEDYQVIPFINDLSYHGAQLLTIKIPVHKNADRLKTTRKVNKHTILDFICKLSFDSWDGVLILPM